MIECYLELITTDPLIYGEVFNLMFSLVFWAHMIMIIPIAIGKTLR